MKKKKSLWVYVVGVLIALVIVNILAWLTGGDTKFHTSALVSIGFLMGMLAMYIAVHLYRYK